MKHFTPHQFRPHLEGLEDRRTPSVSRPIADFLAAQGTTSAFNFGVPGMPDEAAWLSATDVVLAGNGRFARIDYTGQDAAFLGLSLGTTTSGTVSERPLADGRAEVTVNLHTHNAFAWATSVNPDYSNNDLLFGYTPTQLQANPSLAPPLADSDLHLVVKNTAPGAPLPDIVNDFILGNAPPGVELVAVSFHATAAGMTPTGQQATLIVAQTAVPGRTPKLIRDFGFTAEVVDVQVHGSGSAPGTSLNPGCTIFRATVPSSPAHASDVSISDSAFAASLDDLPAWENGLKREPRRTLWDTVDLFG